MPKKEPKEPRVKPIEQVNGVIAVPTGAGLGIEVDRSVIDKYRVA